MGRIVEEQQTHLKPRSFPYLQTHTDDVFLEGCEGSRYVRSGGMTCETLARQRTWKHGMARQACTDKHGVIRQWLRTFVYDPYV